VVSLACFDLSKQEMQQTELCSLESNTSDTIFLSESSLIYVCVNQQDYDLKPISTELIAVQQAKDLKFIVRFNVKILGVNFRKLLRQGESILAFASKDFFIFDNGLKQLSCRQYQVDHIEGRFSNIGEGVDPSEIMLLFAGIYFVKLENKSLV
jgi:hypothetical protein